MLRVSDRFFQCQHQPEGSVSCRFRIADDADNACRFRIGIQVFRLQHAAINGVSGLVRHSRHASVHDGIAQGAFGRHAVDDIHIG
ncbi:hypothetical protein [Phocaeicola sp. RTP21359st1_F7_RTP21360_211022]|uniref:hypothetical protein n=1 Tax=Phocaeicola TaxID=909656 RepID=UPI0034A3F84F